MMAHEMIADHSERLESSLPDLNEQTFNTGGQVARREAVGVVVPVLENSSSALHVRSNVFYLF